jgi:TolB-like protein/DNA-binding winged helix-turn-helix (wHTH) protein/Tfp pilus assembly protein PilF
LAESTAAGILLASNVPRVPSLSSNPAVYRFGNYEFEPRTGELRKQGIRIRFDGQPLAVLLMLLNRPGELVTREELQKKLWPADTFVDFEHSLNAAVKRLRSVLNDSADTPRFIETVPRRGYRFIAPVEGAFPASAPDSTNQDAPSANLEPVDLTIDKTDAEVPAPAGTRTQRRTVWLAFNRAPVAPVRLNPEVPAELERIITKALEKDRKLRHQSAAEIRTDLQRLERDTDSTRVTALNGVAPGGGSSPWWRDKMALAAGGVVLAGLLAFAGWFTVFRSRVEAIDSVAVLPFVNASTDPDAEYLSDGITESLIGQLSQIPQLKILARSTVFRYKGRSIDPQKVGRDLNVRAVLTGRVSERGETLTVSTELMDVTDGSELWGEQYNRKLADILAVQEDIAREITVKLRLRLKGEEEKRLTRHLTVNTEAYQLYLKGRYYWNKRTPDGIQKAIEYFQAAIAKDPGYAGAYAGLADCYQVPANPLPPRERMPRAKAAAMKALQLDDTLVEAHTSLARVLFVYDWDWPAAEKEFKLAIELNPRYAPAHQWHGGYLSATGRFREADAEKNRALELEPLSLVINFEVALAFYFSRNYDQAIDQFQKTLELDANFPPPHTYLPAAYEQKGMFEEAIAGFQRAITVTKGADKILAMASLAHVYAVSGRKTEARKMLAELQRLSEHSYVPAHDVALVYAGLGEKGKAFAWLDKAYEEHSFNLSHLKVEPRFDSLRSDPHFADLLRRIGLPP